MLVKATLIAVFVIPIIFLCGMFLVEAEKMQNAEVQDEQQC